MNKEIYETKTKINKFCVENKAVRIKINLDFELRSENTFGKQIGTAHLKGTHFQIEGGLNQYCCR